jgi:hypothetical protein
MRKLLYALSLGMAGTLGFVGTAAADPPPIVDHEAEAQSLFSEYAPTAVAVILAAAGFVITMKLLGAVVRKVGSVVGRLG